MLPTFCPIPYGRQQISEADKQAVLAALAHPYLTQGPRISQFEEAFATYVGAKGGVAVSNGTAALHLCALALGVQAGHKVITSPLTFAASANCVLYAGGDIHFADIDPQTGLLDIEAVRELLTTSPKGSFQGIIPVDFMGSPVRMDEFRALADEFDLWLIEDSCHAPGSQYQDQQGEWQRCGNGRYADLSIFSFHPVKHIACGEGGMVTGQNEVLLDKIRQLRHHGITRDPGLLTENHGGWYYEMQHLGYNYRLTDIQAALGISQLEGAQAGVERRRAIAKRYDEAFAGSSIHSFSQLPWQRSAYHLYVVQVPNRKEVYDGLREAGIYPQIHYIPLHLQPFYRDKGWKKGDFLHAEQYYSSCLSLPMFPSLTDEQQAYVIEQLQRLVG
ncbi:MAG: UDP-4-amino-4,6-dideoxy-N-acetyl-beta-L-altrosamine transaminase [Bacteroidota bacterium]